MQIVVVADGGSVSSKALAEAVSKHVETRSAGVVGPLWNLTVSQPGGAEAVAVRRAIGLRDIEQLKAVDAESAAESADKAEDDQKKVAPAFEPAIGVGFDKLMLIAVTEDAFGFTVTGVEYDLYLRRLGPTREQLVATSAAAPEAAFQTACGLFSPVAIFSINRDDYHFATLVFRGSELPAPKSSPTWFRAGDVLQPMLRRTDRDGVVPPGGVQAAPWTLLQLTTIDEAVTAKVTSHTRRPFGARRRGRVEQLAVRLSVALPSTRLRLHARDDAARPLVGYHVFARDAEDADLTPLGVSDPAGIVEIPRTEAPVRTLFVKSGSKLVAKLPIVPGADAELAAPLVDDSKRIDAEARLSLLREELIDLVARRSILIARTRAALEAKDYEKASRFVNELEGLPGLNVFNQRLTEQEQLSRARDPGVQARIDKLFEDTRAVLGAFLSSREITELRREVADATNQASL